MFDDKMGSRLCHNIDKTRYHTMQTTYVLSYSGQEYIFLNAPVVFMSLMPIVVLLAPL